MARLAGTKRKVEDAHLDDDAGDNSETDVFDYFSITVAQLKKKIDERGLSRVGKQRKADLVDILEEDDTKRDGVVVKDEEDDESRVSEETEQEGVPAIEVKHDLAVKLKGQKNVKAKQSDAAASVSVSDAAASVSVATDTKGEANDPAARVTGTTINASMSELSKEQEKSKWASMTIPKLKAECGLRGISTSGTKSVIVSRLETDDIDRLELADPNYKPRTDELSIKTGERRMYPFVPRMESGQHDRLRRAHSERLCMMGRKRDVDRWGGPMETFDIAGSTGNCYETIISRVPKCDCVDAKMGNSQCKHIIYCLAIILKAPNDLVCQRAFLRVELEEMFANAPVSQDLNFDVKSAHPGVRKPTEDCECPICMNEFSKDEPIVWCMSACGQNIHAECFNTWKKMQLDSYGSVKCPYCRSNWADDSLDGFAAIKASAPQIITGWGRYAGASRNIAHLDIYKNSPMGTQAAASNKSASGSSKKGK